MVYFHEFSTLFLERTKELISHLNWTDLVAIIVVIRTLYIGFRKGLLIEIFKILGLGAGVFTAVLYYQKWAGVLSERTALSLQVCEGLSFITLFAIGYSVLVFLRFLFAKALMLPIHGVWHRMGGGIFGFCRGCLWLILLQMAALCLASPTGYVAQSIQERSYFGPSLLSGGKVTYQMARHTSTSFVIEKLEEVLQKDGLRSR